MFPSLYFDCQLAHVVTGEIDGQYADPREEERERKRDGGKGKRKIKSAGWCVR